MFWYICEITCTVFKPEVYITLDPQKILENRQKFYENIVYIY